MEAELHVEKPCRSKFSDRAFKLWNPVESAFFAEKIPQLIFKMDSYPRVQLFLQMSAAPISAGKS